MTDKPNSPGHVPPQVVVAIDPGRRKCGLAVVARSGVLQRVVVGTDQVGPQALELARAYQAAAVVVGSRTGSREVMAALRQLEPSLPVVRFEEDMTTLLARRRYWRETPPGCLLRLVPEGMRVPPVPVDDWAAVVIGEQYLHQQSKGERP